LGFGFGARVRLTLLLVVGSGGRRRRLDDQLSAAGAAPDLRRGHVAELHPAALTAPSPGRGLPASFGHGADRGMGGGGIVAGGFAAMIASSVSLTAQAAASAAGRRAGDVQVLVAEAEWRPCLAAHPEFVAP